MTAGLDGFEHAFLTGGDRREALGLLSAIIQDAAVSPARAEVMSELVRRIDHPHPGLASYLALAAGALVESGEPAEPLGRAIVAPLTRALVDAGRMLGHFAAAGEPGSDAAGDDASRVSREMLDDIADRDAPAVRAWASMDIWYRPSVATWTRAPEVLRAAQADAALRAAVTALGHTTETSHWLSLLIETVFAARFVIVLPELGERWQVIVDGISDLGQLAVLLSDALREPLARIGVVDIADADLLAVMRGDGPQETEGGYGCAFHCYRAEAVDPADGLPKDGTDTWRAPGGTGSHSLPSDFLPGTLAILDGARTLVVVGPSAPGGVRFIRGIPAVRTFDKLVARMSAATKL